MYIYCKAKLFICKMHQDNMGGYIYEKVFKEFDSISISILFGT